MEDALDVEGEHTFECGLVVLDQRGAPGGARVVHQDVERVLPRRHLVRQPAALGLFDRSAGMPTHCPSSTAPRPPRHRHPPSATRCTPSPRVDESLGDHPADAPRPAGDERGLAGDVEEVRGGHRPIVPAALTGAANAERAAHQDAGADPQGLVLDQEGGAVVHPARAVGGPAADEEVAARAGGAGTRSRRRWARPAACRRTWSAPTTTAASASTRSVASASLTTARRVLGHLQLHMDALVVAHPVAQVLQAGERLVVLGLGEGAQGAGDQ